MTARAWALAIAAVALGGAAVAGRALAQSSPDAEPDADAGVGPDAAPAEPMPPPPPAGDGLVLVPSGATWRVKVVTSPKPARAIAGAVLGGLDVAAGDAEDGVPIAGDDTLGAPPDGWPLSEPPGAVDALAPLAMGPFDECRCVTMFEDIAPVLEGDRVAILWATTRFEVTRDDLRVLDLGVRYNDGVVVYLNGVEVARRRLEQDARPMEMAWAARGYEWETFHVPVVPGLLRAGDNVISVMVRPSVRRTGPRFDVQLVGRAAAALSRGPVLGAVTTTSATVVLETDLAAAALVEWGPTAALGHRVESTAGVALHHAVELTGLPESSMVYYRALVDGAATPTRSFRTMPGTGRPVRIALYGDVRGGHLIHASLIERIRDEDPDLVLATGDLVRSGSDEGDWQRFFDLTEELLATVPYMSAQGNHDVGRAGDTRRRFSDMFILPELVAGADPRPAWYGWSSFEVGDVHVILLDSNAYDERAQLDWLALDLKAARKRGAKAIIAACHDGPFSRGEHGGNKLAAKKFVPLLVKHDAALLVSGHDHIYQRGKKDGLAYILSGGGGAPLYDVSCTNPKQKCKIKDGMLFVAKEHHYVMLTVYDDFIEACAKRPDGSALEACAKITVP